ncbi:nucleotide sugar dehydrogenase [Lacihabitans soyangensis]|uniref:Nucleotide sugar dehydrogenase n=1 Tax=Lacihabitans soyangensis TaxID=869394 RepID=A0AAE3KWH9_9BACT|nr:nucleotide sugar dehydrogenase [Lacihabitans soyangensis]MCP9762895.1 nucleotide sugar dehydrogenase [Lacihabitans soyangensis]
MNHLNNINIVICGLGYVGLPLAVEFGKKYPTIGFDINSQRISELEAGLDKTLEITSKELSEAKYLNFESDLSVLGNIKMKNIFIVTVPTPIDIYKKPDLTPLISVSKTIGEVLKIGDIVIYESTVYPGCTEDDCVPVLEKHSGLKFNQDFFCGYSPERINPGDKKNTLTKILKITSGSTPEVADFVDDLYGSIIEAGTYKAPSLKVAEAAKLIENCQRDVNISFVNELALIFEKMNLDTTEVLKAAGTKWNFLKFQPGLVGGHCIGVDPYYMLYKSEQLGYYPALIGSGRRINDNMGVFVANKVVKLMISKGINVKDSKALILGFTFKENCPDIRNTKVIDIYNELKDFGIHTEIYDPWADAEEVNHEYGIALTASLNQKYDLIIHAVNHEVFEKLNISDFASDTHVLFDVKSTLDKSIVDARL